MYSIRYILIFAFLIALAESLLYPAPAKGLQIQNTFRRMLDQPIARVAENTQANQTAPGNRPLPGLDLNIPASGSIDDLPMERVAANEVKNSIEYFELIAIQNHPRLAQLQYEIDAVKAEAVQVALPPNPQAGLFGDEIFNEGQAGFYGAFVTETRVPLEKLRSRARVKCVESEVLEAQLEVARQKIRTDVRTAFFNVLIAQRQHQLASELADSYSTAIQTMQNMFAAGEITRSDILQVEIQYQQAVASRSDADAMFYSSWRELAAVIGDTTLAAEKVEGTLDSLSDELDFNTVLADYVERSPELKTANAKINQAQAILQREQANSMPNTQTQWRIGRDSGSEDVYAGFQVTVPIQKYNRNQGNISAAQSRLQSAHVESELLARELAQRLAREFQNYQSARNRARIYVNEILPKARESLQMVNRAYEGGEASFLQLLTSQRTLINSTTAYLGSLKKLWNSRQKIEGLLLSDSLDRNFD